MNTRSAKITGLPGESGWAQVHDFKPEDPEKLRLRGHLFAVVATRKIEGGVEVVNSGRELISRLHEEYFGDLSTKPFNALTSAVGKVIGEFKETWGDVEIAACAIVGNVVFSSAGGGTKVIISRNGSLATILDSTSNVVSASGYPKTGDVILLGTKTFFEKFTSGTIKEGLENHDPESAAESFAPVLHEADNVGTVGAAIVKFNEERVDAPVVSVEEPPQKPQMTFENAKSSFSGFISGLVKKIPARRIYVREPMNDEVVSQSKRLTFTVAIALIVILAISIGFGIRQKKINDLKKQYQGILEQASQEVDQAISLASVSPDQSRELFADSMQKLDQIDALNIKDPKVELLRSRINESRGAILGEYEVTPEAFLDLGLLSSGFKGDSLSVSGGNIYILDRMGKRIVSVAISTKKSKVVAGPGVIDEALDLAAYEDRVFVLGGDGIYEIGTTKDKVINKVWGGDAFVRAFAGNMYVLDKSGNAIYRYAGSGNTFGDKQDWLAASTQADFSDAKSWGIDGSIYVLYPNSRVLKYSRGSPQSFRISSVIPEIGSVDALYADPDNQDVYLLDRAGKRIVVVDKNGQYKAQYVNDAIANVTNLVVSEADKKIILLTEDKLFSVDIKHLQ